jgi:hypothetical protein
MSYAPLQKRPFAFNSGTAKSKKLSTAKGRARSNAGFPDFAGKGLASFEWRTPWAVGEPTATGTLAATAEAVGAAPSGVIQRTPEDADETQPATLPDAQELTLTGMGEPGYAQMAGGCDGLVLHGHTSATFNGGSFHIEGGSTAQAKGCDCPKGVQCLRGTGTLVTDYVAVATVDMPAVPDGLTECEQQKVTAFLSTVLRAHEEDHKARLETYTGQTKQDFDVTACGEAAIKSQVKALQSAENNARQNAARSLSNQIDPFTRTVDCSPCYKKAGPPDAGAPLPK